MLKKSFWILIIILATLCSYLAANLVSLYLKTVWDVPPKVTSIDIAEEKGQKKDKNREEFYQIIAKRDLFQINTQQKEGKAEEAQEDVVAPITDLKLKLLGTMVGKGITSYAIIKDLKQKKQDIYLEGDEVGPARLLRIYRNKVILLHEGSEEMLLAFEELEERDDASSGSQGASFPEPSNRSRTAFKQVPNQIGQKIAPNHWIIERKELDDTIGNASQLLTQMRILPHFKDGKMDQPDGFQVSNIRSRSFFERMGLRSGDVIKAVNGEPMDNPDRAFEAYQRLKNEPSVMVTVLRNNKEVNLQYDIND